MKVDKKVVQELITNLEVGEKDFLKNYHSIIARMEEATTVEGLMSLKQEMLYTWVEYFPSGGDKCYFCVQRKGAECNKCPYAAIHGICGLGINDWGKLAEAIEELDVAIQGYYQDDIYHSVKTDIEVKEA